jgi:3-oxoacid CoA-transferase subunit B
MAGERLDDNAMAMRAAREFEEGMLVNLGIGIPTLASSYVPGEREVIFHSENGVLGFGPIVEDASAADIYLVNAGIQPVSPNPGMCFVSHEESFAIIRGGHIDVSVLGALEVSEKGDLANYQLPGKATGSFGGGQDLAFCARKVIALTTHQTKDGRPKIVRSLSLPITAPRAVDEIITDIAVIEVTRDGLVLREYMPGWTPEEIQAVTEPPLQIAPDLKEISLA